MIPEAEAAYETGLKKDPNNEQLRNALGDVRKQMGAVTNPFAHPRMYPLLHANPITKEYLKDPSYVDMIEKLRTDPNPLQR